MRKPTTWARTEVLHTSFLIWPVEAVPHDGFSDLYRIFSPCRQQAGLGYFYIFSCSKTIPRNLVIIHNFRLTAVIKPANLVSGVRNNNLRGASVFPQNIWGLSRREPPCETLLLTKNPLRRIFCFLSYTVSPPLKSSIPSPMMFPLRIL